MGLATLSGHGQKEVGKEWVKIVGSGARRTIGRESSRKKTKIGRNRSVNFSPPHLWLFIGVVIHETEARWPRCMAVIPTFSHTSCVNHARESRGWLINYRIKEHDRFFDKT